ncbi:uncharacterized protein LOC134190654 [Corticium candelabrum]|uniref:uncharacterized protein LOC134190654 n=1 Tax=Corticium candelabrum TaxID=121492 RepID=UPI002E265ECC|nr:uncharacterized protein LOC134190654 [Corticium candelabrum]
MDAKVESELTVGSMEMPIKEVVLYNNGYGVFLREVPVSGRGHIDLFFREPDMKDVLQSLCFKSAGGLSGLGNISYESSRPQAHIQLKSTNPLTELLQSLKGTRIRVGLKTSETVEGVVLGVDENLTSCDGSDPVPHVTLLTDDGRGLHSLEISAIANTVILDAAIRHDIQHALELFRSEKKRNMQRLTVFYHNMSSNDMLSVKYGLRVGEWKCSYRMVLSDHPTKFHLDGFAIITNTQEEDWTDVKLSLVVGAPPLGSSSDSSGNRRSSNQGSLELEIKPIHGSSFFIRAEARDTVETIKEKINDKKGILIEKQRLLYAGKQMESGRTLSDYNIANGACINLVQREGGAMRNTRSSQRQFVMAAEGNLSFYCISMPVTAKRKQTAIVPLLQSEMVGQKVVLYDGTIRKGNPLCAILFENTTGRTLEGGSVQVMNDEHFLGDGSFQTLYPRDESPPIPYAVELDCEVTLDHNVSVLRVHHVKISDAEAKLYRYRRHRSMYRIFNKTERELDFMLNHEFLDGWDLMQPHVEEEEPVDITDRFYQFRFVVKATDEKTLFNVREEIQDEETVDLHTVLEETVTKWVEKRVVDHQTAGILRETLVLRKQSDDLVKNVYEKENEIREVKETQSRLRENIQALQGFERDSAKYVKSLAAEEDKLKALHTQIKSLRQDKTERHKQVTEKLKRIDFTCDVKYDTAEEDGK